jgi:putative transposase
LSSFSEKSSEAKKAYIEFVLQKEPEEIEKFYAKKNPSSTLGDDTFEEWIKEKFQDFRFHQEIPESHILAPKPEDIIDYVSRQFKVRKESFTKYRRGTENVPRDMVYLWWIYTKETPTGIGRYFKIANYSKVSSIIERIKARKAIDKAFADQLNKLEKKLGKAHRKAKTGGAEEN